MSSFSLQSFEKSLRSSSGSYQVPISTPLKTEIHKGCTGKAHACGSIKSTNTVLANKPTPKPKVKSDGKTLRKNSLSSETVSDSGSEISSSWNSNKDSSASSTAVAPVNLPKPLKRTKSVNYGSSNASTVAARRRTSDSVISVDVPDNVRNGIRRGRLMSDGGGENIDGGDDASRLKRASSFRLKNVPPMVPPKPKISQPPPTPIKRNGSFNNRLRNSFRSKTQITNWNTLWESSLALKNGGGSLRILDKKLLEVSDKVNKTIYFTKRLYD